MSTTIITAYTAPDGNRYAAVRWQGADYHVKQTPKLTTTVWTGSHVASDSVRVTKSAHPHAFHVLVGAAFDEWERMDRAAVAATETTVETWGPDAVAVTREYGGPQQAGTCARCGRTLYRRGDALELSDGSSYCAGGGGRLVRHELAGTVAAR